MFGTATGWCFVGAWGTRGRRDVVTSGARVGLSCCGGSVSMMLNPNKKLEVIPYTKKQQAPEKYVWEKKSFGSMKPGTAGDNYPLEKILGVWKDMTFQEFERDERACDLEVMPPDEDFLEMLASSGRLVARAGDDEDGEHEKIRSGITEEDLEFDGEESEALSYYSRTESNTAMADPLQAEYGFSYDGSSPMQY
mmetsp:Transcript_12183/g.26657  ORF Transcript_12183/g.26657 Transcript_12183/m.26657 type:complete len:194 (+) Transcript_12183:74-655(+)